MGEHLKEKQIEYINTLINYYKIKIDKLEKDKIVYKNMLEIIENQ